MSRKCRKEAESWEAWAIPEEQLAVWAIGEKELAEKLGVFEVPSLEVEVPAFDIELPPLEIDTTSLGFEPVGLGFEPIEYSEGEPCHK